MQSLLLFILLIIGISTTGAKPPVSSESMVMYLPLALRYQQPSTWQQLALPGERTRAVAPGTEPEQLLAGGEVSGAHQSTTCGNDWTDIGPPGAFVLDVLASDDAILVGTFGESLFRRPVANPVWTQINIGNPYVWSLLQSGNTVYAATDNGTYRSPNGGQSWSQWNAGLSGTGLLNNDLLMDDAGTLWLATFGGGIFRRPEGASSWTPVNNGLSDAAMRAWALVLGPEGHLLAATADGVYHLSQAGQWQRFGLDGLTVYSLASGHDGTVFAGTAAHGVFRRRADTDSWQAINEGWSTTMEVRDLLVLETCNGLFAATEDGIWRYPVP